MQWRFFLTLFNLLLIFGAEGNAMTRDALQKKISRTKPNTLELTVDDRKEPLIISCPETSGQEISSMLEQLQWSEILAKNETGVVMWVVSENEPSEEQPQQANIPPMDMGGMLREIVSQVIRSQREILDPITRAYSQSQKALTDALGIQGSVYKEILSLSMEREQTAANNEADALAALQVAAAEVDAKKGGNDMAQIVEVAGPAIVALLDALKSQKEAAREQSALQPAPPELEAPPHAASKRGPGKVM